MVYLIKSRLLKIQDYPSIECPACRQKGEIKIAIYQRYVWLIWPVRSAGKFGVAYCDHCHTKLTAVQWTDEIEEEYLRIKKETSTPKGLWRGLFYWPLSFFAIILCIYLFVNSIKVQRANTDQIAKSYMEIPHIGDLYWAMDFTHTPVPNFTYLRLTKINGDTLFVQRLNQSSPDFNGEKQLLPAVKNNDFSAEILPMDFKHFKKYYDFIRPGEMRSSYGIDGLERDGKTFDIDRLKK